jgi:transcriptional regulator with XRE-family HTH domain
MADAFGTAIREKRHALKLSQEELAARCGLHRTYLADVERGQRNPSLVSILRIASGLGVPASDLLAATEAHLKPHGRRS